jgi:hypothetical protein
MGVEVPLSFVLSNPSVSELNSFVRSVCVLVTLLRERPRCSNNQRSLQGGGAGSTVPSLPSSALEDLAFDARINLGPAVGGTVTPLAQAQAVVLTGLLNICMCRSVSFTCIPMTGATGFTGSFLLRELLTRLPSLRWVPHRRLLHTHLRCSAADDGAANVRLQVFCSSSLLSASYLFGCLHFCLVLTFFGVKMFIWFEMNTRLLRLLRIILAFLQEALKARGIEVDWSRVDVRSGDLANGLLGLPDVKVRRGYSYALKSDFDESTGKKAFNALCRGVDAVFHAAATVNWMLPYSALRGANVAPCHDLIRLCTTGKVKVFVASPPRT